MGRRNGGAALGALAPAGVVATVIYVLFIGLPIVALLARAGQEAGFLAGLTGPWYCRRCGLPLLPASSV